LYDEIIGLSPTISIDQKTTNRNPRSTVGTITEIYDYYKLLYLNIGERKCVECGQKIQKDSVKDIISYVSQFSEGTKFFITCPILKDKKDITEEKIKKEVLDAGFIRFLVNGEEYNVNSEFTINKKNLKIDIVVDRLVVKDFSQSDDANTKRLKDSIDVAYKNGGGQMAIHVL